MRICRYGNDIGKLYPICITTYIKNVLVLNLGLSSQLTYNIVQL